MNILIIVLALMCAYVLFVSASFLLIRLLFPKIEIDEGDGVRPVKTRDGDRYAARTIKKQKNLAY